jgi:hypothetical protein
MSHFEKHAILTEAQHGFRSRRSCESQLIYTVHELTKGLSEEKQARNKSGAMTVP